MTSHTAAALDLLRLPIPEEALHGRFGSSYCCGINRYSPGSGGRVGLGACVDLPSVETSIGLEVHIDFERRECVCHCING